MRLYGAYGSNLNLKQMQRRCPGAYPLYSFYLDNYSLVFKGVADLEKQVGSISFMAVYEITKLCEVALDMYEEYPDVYNVVESVAHIRTSKELEDVKQEVSSLKQLNQQANKESEKQ